MTSHEDLSVVPGVTLRRSHVADGAVAMLDVVPGDELGGPVPGIVKRGEAACRGLGTVLRGAKQRFGVGVVVRDPGREQEGSMPSQFSIASTVVALSVEPLSPCSTGLASAARMPSARALRRTRWAA